MNSPPKTPTLSQLVAIGVNIETARKKMPLYRRRLYVAIPRPTLSIRRKNKKPSKLAKAMLARDIPPQYPLEYQKALTRDFVDGTSVLRDRVNALVQTYLAPQQQLVGIEPNPGPRKPNAAAAQAELERAKSRLARAQRQVDKAKRCRRDQRDAKDKATLVQEGIEPNPGPPSAPAAIIPIGGGCRRMTFYPDPNAKLEITRGSKRVTKELERDERLKTAAIAQITAATGCTTQAAQDTLAMGLEHAAMLAPDKPAEAATRAAILISAAVRDTVKETAPAGKPDSEAVATVAASSSSPSTSSSADPDPPTAVERIVSLSKDVTQQLMEEVDKVGRELFPEKKGKTIFEGAASSSAPALPQPSSGAKSLFKDLKGVKEKSKRRFNGRADVEQSILRMSLRRPAPPPPIDGPRPPSDEPDSRPMGFGLKKHKVIPSKDSVAKKPVIRVRDGLHPTREMMEEAGMHVESIVEFESMPQPDFDDRNIAFLPTKKDEVGVVIQSVQVRSEEYSLLHFKLGSIFWMWPALAVHAARFKNVKVDLSVLYLCIVPLTMIFKLFTLSPLTFVGMSICVLRLLATRAILERKRWTQVAKDVFDACVGPAFCFVAGYLMTRTFISVELSAVTNDYTNQYRWFLCFLFREVLRACRYREYGRPTIYILCPALLTSVLTECCFDLETFKLRGKVVALRTMTLLCIPARLSQDILVSTLDVALLVLSHPQCFRYREQAPTLVPCRQNVGTFTRGAQGLVKYVKKNCNPWRMQYLTDSVIYRIVVLSIVDCLLVSSLIFVLWRVTPLITARCAMPSSSVLVWIWESLIRNSWLGCVALCVGGVVLISNPWRGVT
jgi:hypothetical protein